jgi:virulence-associated protein VagC/predicted nucleic acid-binding protein
MEPASVFKSNKSQAVRPPKPVALPESVTRVDMIALGRARLIVPAGEAWDFWFDTEGVSDDFMDTREQPADQERGALRACSSACSTHIVIHVIKNCPQAARERFTRHQGQIAIFTVTRMERVYGAEKSSQPERNLRDIEGLAARLAVLPWDEAAAIHTGQIRAELARTGTPSVPTSR